MLVAGPYHTSQQNAHYYHGAAYLVSYVPRTKVQSTERKEQGFGGFTYALWSEMGVYSTSAVA